MTATSEEFPHDQVSSRTLVLSSIGAAVLAAIALVLFILPAEYGIDPTGAGKALGLDRLAQTAAVKRNTLDEDAEGYRKDTVEIEIPPAGGLEYKLHVKKGDHFEYSWTSPVPLYFDFHGEPDGDDSGYFESYAEGTAAGLAGSLNAPFDGRHGWYWENRTDQPVTVKLLTFGIYTVVGKL
jgi:hypothetical protein